MPPPFPQHRNLDSTHRGRANPRPTWIEVPSGIADRIEGYDEPGGPRLLDCRHIPGAGKNRASMTARCLDRRSDRRLAGSECCVKLPTVLRALSVPAGNVRGPLYMDQVLAALHQGNAHRVPVTLAVIRHAGEVTLCCRFPAEVQGLLEGQLYAQYPEAKIAELSDDGLDPPAGANIWTAELQLHHDLFPIKRFAQFEDSLNRQNADPVSAILSSLGGDERWVPAIEIIIRPAGRGKTARMRRVLRQLARPFFRAHHRLAKLYLKLSLSQWRMLRFTGWMLGRIARHGGPAELRALDTSGSRQHDREEDLQAGSDKAGRLLFETHIRLHSRGNTDKRTGRRSEIEGNRRSLWTVQLPSCVIPPSFGPPRTSQKIPQSSVHAFDRGTGHPLAPGDGRRADGDDDDRAEPGSGATGAAAHA